MKNKTNVLTLGFMVIFFVILGFVTSDYFQKKAELQALKLQQDLMRQENAHLQALKQQQDQLQQENARLQQENAQLQQQLLILTLTGTPPVLLKTPAPTQTTIPNLALKAAFEEVDNQFNNTLKGSLAFNKPSQMKKEERTEIELILNPSVSESILAAQLAEQGGFVTSTAEPNVLIAPNGETVTVKTDQVEITPRMKAVLLAQDPQAFTVKEMHDNAEQVVSSVNTTTWRWSVIAKKEGLQTLELIIYQLVKYDGKEFWHEVETYKADIVVEVTLGDKVKSLDWKWIFATLLIPLAAGLWAWWKNRNKKPDVMQVKIVDEKKSPKKKKEK